MRDHPSPLKLSHRQNDGIGDLDRDHNQLIETVHVDQGSRKCLRNKDDPVPPRGTRLADDPPPSSCLVPRMADKFFRSLSQLGRIRGCVGAERLDYAGFLLCQLPYY